MPIVKVLNRTLRKEVVRDNWPIRRRWMKVWAIGFAVNAEAIVIDTIWRGGSTLGVQIFITLITALCSLMFFYVFGAVYDDRSKRSILSNFSHEDEDDKEDEDPPLPADDPLKAKIQPNNAG